MALVHHSFSPSTLGSLVAKHNFKVTSLFPPSIRVPSAVTRARGLLAGFITSGGRSPLRIRLVSAPVSTKVLSIRGVPSGLVAFVKIKSCLLFFFILTLPILRPCMLPRSLVGMCVITNSSFLRGEVSRDENCVGGMLKRTLTGKPGSGSASLYGCRVCLYLVSLMN